MTAAGVKKQEGAAAPGLVPVAVEAARRAGFSRSCLPEQGRLLQLLASGAGPGRIGETGTGYGVGLAWLASGAHAGAELVSVERDLVRADAAREIFTGDPRVRAASGPGRTPGPEDQGQLLIAKLGWGGWL